MSADVVAVLRTQFDLVWALFQISLDQLTDDECHWTPVADDRTATVRRDGAGRWVADWSGLEVEPYLLPTIAWLTWHLGWWWSTTIAHATAEPVPDRVDVTWPGSADATRDWLGDPHDRWLDVLDGLTETDLDAIAPFPWPSRPDRTVANMVAWVNAELMKNVAEIGRQRILRTAMS